MYILHGYLLYLVLKTEISNQKSPDSDNRNKKQNLKKSDILDFLAKSSNNIAAAAKSIKSLF